jgi:hypothetical protein
MANVVAASKVVHAEALVALVAASAVLAVASKKF